MKKHVFLMALGVCIVLVFLGHAARIFPLGPLNDLEMKAYDYRLRWTMPAQSDDRIVILDIDEKSLKEIGHWPWSRDRMALLMDKLFDDYHVAAVGFDVIFGEKDNSSGLPVLEDLAQHKLKGVREYQNVLQQLRPQLDYDTLFAERLARHRIVLGYYFSSSDDDVGADRSGQLPAPVLSAEAFAGHPVHFSQWDGYGANLAELQSHALSAGHFNSQVDADGIVRRTPMLIEYQGKYYESLSMAMVRALTGGTSDIVPGFINDAPNAELDHINIKVKEGAFRIPVNSDGTSLIPYRGKRGSYRYISAVDVLNGQLPLTELKNKIILVGTSAPGLMDMRSTPVDEVYPGVEVHANMISGIIDQSIKQYSPFVVAIEIILLLVVGLAMALLLPLVTPLVGTLITFGILLVSVACNFYLWKSSNLALPFASSLLMVVLIYMLNMTLGYFMESRTKRKITSLFGQYVPMELVEEMSKKPDQVSMEGEGRDMTILFSDVRSFTTISEGLNPRELSELMNEFLTPLSRVIYHERGTIDKYMGDCIMAFWGAPLHEPRHAYHAIVAGLEMLHTLEKLQPHFRARGWPEIRIGVGLNTGHVSVGNMGSEVRVAYTVMGDAVNLASRLEGLTGEYGLGIIVGENTRKEAPEFFYREIDLVRVKGKETPVAIFEPIALNNGVDAAVRAEVEEFHRALSCYRRQDWEAAATCIQGLRTAWPDKKLYKIYAERIAYYRENPPGPEWNGVHVFKTK